MRAAHKLALLVLLMPTEVAFAQDVTGALDVRVTDAQGLHLPDVKVTVRNTSTGFERASVTAAAGTLRIVGLPVAIYEARTRASGFGPQVRTGIAVNVGATTVVEFGLEVARAEEMTVGAESPLIDVTDSGISELVTAVQIENLPLNGRQFGNLAALVPGVGLGFHPAPTKSTQLAPQVAGGTGRNINYVIDGGDDNDDTGGGLAQNFPLDSIDQFHVHTHRFRAEFGRSSGGVMSVVTRSGTNALRGSGFTYFRDRGLNSRTETERRNGLAKQDYRRYHFGASLGGPILKDRTHFFASFERIHQDTTQAVSTAPGPGRPPLFPEKDGVFGLPFRENIVVAKVNHQLDRNHFLTVRYGYNDTSQVDGSRPQAPPESWGTSRIAFHSANAGLNSVIGAGRLNEFVFQFSSSRGHTAANSDLPQETFPSGVAVGRNPNVESTREQQKYQFRDDLTWTRGSHELKVGVSLISEPRLALGIGSPGDSSLAYTYLEDRRDSPVFTIARLETFAGSANMANVPNQQYAAYVQDTWRATRRLVLYFGIRYDLVTGYADEEPNNQVTQDLQAAGRAGLFRGPGFPCPCPGFEDWGKDPRDDTNNVAPRVGFSYDAKGDGRLVVRGGVGRYFDFGYTNGTILIGRLGDQVARGTVYFHTNSRGIRNPDGSLFRVGDPLPPNQLGDVSRPIPQWGSNPRVKHPYTDQANLGLSWALGRRVAVEVDGVYSRGRDLPVIFNPNVRMGDPAGPRRFRGLLPRVGDSNFNASLSGGRSSFKAVTLALKKQWDGHTQLLASYTLSEARSTARAGNDEFLNSIVIDAFDPFNEVQFGPGGTDARHKVTVSGIWRPAWGLTIAPVFRYRSSLPYTVITGTDDNGNGVINDLPPGAPHVNQARGSAFSQLDLRLAKTIPLGGKTRLELLVDGFNLLDARNPVRFVGNMRAANFGQPTAYAGDFQAGEQRVVQLGARIEF
jgi:hypothetical protein